MWRMSRSRVAVASAVLGTVLGFASSLTAQTPAPEPRRTLIKIAYAEYPPEALAKEISGTVPVTMTVNAAGQVTTANATAGPLELRASASKAAMGMKYSPASDTSEIRIALDYHLDALGWGVRVLQQISANGFSSFGGSVSGGPGTAPGTPVQTPDGPYRVGGTIAPPRKIKDLAPVYPPTAQRAGIQGVVILEAVIDETGAVTSAKVLRSIPLLDEAAKAAVMQWQYTPTLLNGVAVPIIMTVTVNFSLRPSLEFTLEGGAKTRVGLDATGHAMTSVPGSGRFGFEVTNGSSPAVKTIKIYDIGNPGSEPRLLGSVDVTLNGGSVNSPTTPSFGLALIGPP